MAAFRFVPKACYRLEIGRVCFGWLDAGLFYRGSARPYQGREPDGRLQDGLLVDEAGTTLATLQGDCLRMLQPGQERIVIRLIQDGILPDSRRYMSTKRG